MDTKLFHRYLGLFMALPLLLWAMTGVVFLVKPGYEGAYERLSPKLYEIEQTFELAPSKGWKKVELQRTILGYHLLVEDESGWKNIDPTTMRERPHPSKAQIEQFITDAISDNRQRYGEIQDIQNEVVHTDTGVEININWNTMELSQSGRDTRIINAVYKIHYLQWLGISPVDKILGIVGIVSLLALTVLGISVYTGRRDIDST